MVYIDYPLPAYFERDSGRPAMECQVSSLCSSRASFCFSRPQGRPEWWHWYRSYRALWLSIGFDRRPCEWESKFWVFFPWLLPCEVVLGCWVPDPVVTVLLEAATLCDSPVGPGTCFLPHPLQLVVGVGVTVLLLLTWFPLYLWWSPICPTHTLANNPFGKETLK